MFLILRGVLSKGGGKCPPGIDPSIVKSFVDKGAPTPKEHPNLLDWSAPLTSTWNSQAIYLLCSDFRKEVESGQHPQVINFLKSLPEIDGMLMQWCMWKVRRNRTEYLDNTPPATHLGETAVEKSNRVNNRKSKAKIRDRRGTRKASVRCIQ